MVSSQLGRSGSARLIAAMRTAMCIECVFLRELVALHKASGLQERDTR